ncbi:MAG: type II toxin-antitoxin system HicA family toxin [Bacteroidota bacterium]
MRLPRDVSAETLVNLLKKFGYRVTRQSGSHIRLTTDENGEHHLTIPNHNPLKIGTLSAVLNDVASHFNKTKDEITSSLFTQ